MTIREYLSKMKGGAKSPPGVGFSEVLWALAGSAIAICICEYLSARYFEPRDLTLVVGSLGASAVLVYGAIRSPFAQPRNLVGGHVISGLVGVACFQLFGETSWLAAPLAVSLAIAAMLVTKTVHPPGGATALIAVIGGAEGACPRLPLPLRSGRAGRVDPPGGRAPDKQPFAGPKLSRLLVLKNVLQMHDILPVIEREKQQHVLPQMAGDQEVVPDVLAAVLSDLPGVIRAGEQLLDGKGGPFRRVAQ